MTDQAEFNDGLKSYAKSTNGAHAGLGGNTDKAASLAYSFQELSVQQLIAAHRASWVCKQVVQLPAKDATRKWRTWSGDGADAIMKAEREFGLQHKTYRAKWLSRLLGGAVILIGTGEDTEEPLDPSTIGRGDLKYLTVLDRSEITATDIERDPREARYGMPSMFEVNTNTGTSIKVDPSRVAEFYGEEKPMIGVGTASSFGWGDSILQCAYDACVNMDSVMANVAGLVFEAKTDVIKIPGLMEQIQNPAYEEALRDRAAIARQIKGNMGTMMLDKDEDYEQRTYSFAGLPDVTDRFMQVVAAAADIPITRLLNQSPGGMNSTGESDLLNYYDSVESIQKNEIAPTISGLDEVLIRSTIGDMPDDLKSNWTPLKQMTVKETSELRNKDADTVSKLVAAGVADELIEELAHQMFQQSGLELSSLEEDGDDLDEDDTDE